LQKASPFYFDAPLDGPHGVTHFFGPHTFGWVPSPFRFRIGFPPFLLRNPPLLSELNCLFLAAFFLAARSRDLFDEFCESVFVGLFFFEVTVPLRGYLLIPPAPFFSPSSKPFPPSSFSLIAKPARQPPFFDQNFSFAPNENFPSLPHQCGFFLLFLFFLFLPSGKWTCFFLMQSFFLSSKTILPTGICARLGGGPLPLTPPPPRVLPQKFPIDKKLFFLASRK